MTRQIKVCCVSCSQCPYPDCRLSACGSHKGLDPHYPDPAGTRKPTKKAATAPTATAKENRIPNIVYHISRPMTRGI